MRNLISTNWACVKYIRQIFHSIKPLTLWKYVIACNYLLLYALQQVLDNVLETIDNILAIEDDTILRESQEESNASRRYECSVQFLPHFRITHHWWSIIFIASICNVLYGFLWFISFTTVLCPLYRILESIEILGRELEVENDAVTFAQDNFALVLGDVDTNNYRGQTFTIETDIDVLDAFDSDQISTTDDQETSSTGACSFTLPGSLFDGSADTRQRISYSVFSDDSLFQTRNASDRQLGGVIFSVDIPGIDNIVNLPNPVRMRFQIAQVLWCRKLCIILSNVTINFASNRQPETEAGIQSVCSGTPYWMVRDTPHCVAMTIPMHMFLSLPCHTQQVVLVHSLLLDVELRQQQTEMSNVNVTIWPVSVSCW